MKKNKVSNNLFDRIEIPFKQLDRINWDKITELQAVELASVMSVFDDALQAFDRAKIVNVINLLTLFVNAVLLLMVLYHYDQNTEIIEKTVISSFTIFVVIGWLYTMKVRHSLNLSLRQLEVEISKLPLL